MAKVTMRIDELIAEVFAAGKTSKSTGKASISFYSSTAAVVCPLCGTKVKAKTLHKCQKESK